MMHIRFLRRHWSSQAHVCCRKRFSGLVAAIVGVVMTLNAVADTYSDGATGLSWSYIVGDDGAATITGVSRARGDLHVPARLGSVRVSGIGVEAFKDSVQLLTVEIADGVLMLGEKSFNGCVALRHVVIPSSVNSVGANSFGGCGLLKSAVVPGRFTLKNIGLTALTNVVISEGSPYVCDHMMEGCGMVEKVVLPQTITKIGDYAFSGCGGITSFVLPNSVDVIGQYAFSECSELKTIQMPVSANTIGEGAFRNCSKLVTIRIPSGVSRIEKMLFENCGELKSVAIPDAVENIGPYAFHDCWGLTTISLPRGLKAIESYAFYHCGLTSVSFPATLTTIGEWAFYYCDNLKGIDIPFSVKDTGVGAFCHTDIRSIKVPGHFNCYDAFFLGGSQGRNEKISEVVITDGSVSIVEKSFSGLQNLTTVSIPEGVESIGDFAFKYCESLRSVGLPQSLKLIGREAFRSSGLMTIDIPEGVEEIGSNAFAGCDKLGSVSIPKSVREIGEEAFAECCGLNEVQMRAQITVLRRGTFCGCSSLTEFQIPASVVELEDCLYRPYYDSGVPCGVFAMSGLTSIIIPRGIKKVGDFAFYGCQNLTTALFEGDMPECGWRIFYITDQYYFSGGVPIISTCKKLPTVIYAYSDADGWPWSGVWDAPAEKEDEHGHELRIVDRPSGVTVLEKGYGTVRGGGVCDVGTEVTLVATPDVGYKFSHWEYFDGRTSIENPLKFKVTSHVFVDAVFVLKTPDITTVTSSCDGILLSWSQTETASSYKIYRRIVGSDTALQIAAIEGNANVTWFDDGCAFGASYEYWVESVGKENSWCGAPEVASRKEVVLTLNANGGSSDTESMTTVAGVVRDLPTPVREAYTFLGWFTAKEGGLIVKNGDRVTKDVTLFAHWKLNPYLVTFDANGGICAEQTRTYEVGAAYGNLPVANRVGYSFLGWFSSAAGGEKIAKDTVVPTNVTIYAQWKAAGYSVLLCGGSEFEGVSLGEIFYGDEFVPMNAWRMVPGSRICGWAIVADGEIAYAAGSAISNLTTTVGAEVKLYAVWGDAELSPRSFCQRYPWNGLVDVDFALNGDVGFEYPLLLEVVDNIGGTNLPVRTILSVDGQPIGNPFKVHAGHRRVTWNADMDLPDGYKCKFASARLRHAMAVQFDACGGMCEIERRYYVLNEEYGTLPTPTMDGYAFKGWYSDAEYKEAVTRESLAVPSVAILYAKWETEK